MKIYLFRNQKDYEKILTKDDVLNVIGTKGSGKTTSSLDYIHDSNYIVVNCDRLLDLPSGEEEDPELSKIRSHLLKKFGTISEGEKFLPCYQEILSYISRKHKKAFIEGNLIQDLPYDSYIGKIIIKRTASFTSFIRAVKRDYHNSYFMKLEKEKHPIFYRVTRLYHITKRRMSVFQQAKEIEKMLDYFEKH